MQKKFTVLNLKMILRIFQQWKVCNLSSFTWKSFHLVDIRTFLMRNSIKILFHIDMVQNKENKIEEVGYNVCTMEWESENVWWVLQIHSRTFFYDSRFYCHFRSHSNVHRYLWWSIFIELCDKSISLIIRGDILRYKKRSWYMSISTEEMEKGKRMK